MDSNAGFRSFIRTLSKQDLAALVGQMLQKPGRETREDKPRENEKVWEGKKKNMWEEGKVIEIRE